MTTFRDRQKRRQEKFTQDYILKLVSQPPHRFVVSLCYRDDWLRSRCMKMVKAKLLRKERGISRGHVVFKAKVLTD